MEREDVKHAPRRSSRGSLLYQDASQLTVGSQHSRRSTVTYASNRTETSLASDASRRQTNRGWVPVSHPCRGRCPVLQRPVGHTTHNLTKPVSNGPLPVLKSVFTYTGPGAAQVRHQERAATIPAPHSCSTNRGTARRCPRRRLGLYLSPEAPGGLQTKKRRISRGLVW